MFRKISIACVAAAAITVAAAPTTAEARWHGGGHGWHGGWHHHWHGGWGWGAGPRFYGGYYPYAAYAGCYRTRRVLTPWGWRWRRVWVCG